MKQKITIVGGGLTGLALAVGLRRHEIPVEIFEAGTYPRHRVCGEFISGIEPSTLDYLGISKQFTNAQKHLSISWFRGEKFLRCAKLPAPAIGISRYHLDQRLHQYAIELGVEFHTNQRWRGDTQANGLVKTTGRKPLKSEWIGLKTHIRGIQLESDLEMHSGPIGYLGLTPVEDGYVNACGLFKIHPQIKAKKEDLLSAYLRENGNHQLSHRLDFADWRKHAFSAVAGFHLGFQKQHTGEFILGDSYSIIPPFTGNGMTMALQSAETALPFLIAYSRNEMSWEQARVDTLRALKKRFWRRVTVAKFFHPLLFASWSSPLLRKMPFRPALQLVR